MKKILFLMVAAFAVAFAACEKDNEGNLYTISVTAGEGGTVAGDNGKHKAGEELKFVAVPDNGYTFLCWSDGLKNNPRTIVVDSDIMLVALFAKSNGNNNGGNNQNNGENNGENNGGNGNNEQNTDDSPYYFTSGYWDGTLPIRENQVSQNHSSQFFFYDENGEKYGNEDSYYKGSLDNSYDFSWEWNDDSHSVLILNYGGSWAEDKCCIDIKEFNSDHIYGYFYKTLTDYATNHKNNTGTKVELKHLENLATNADFSNLAIIAQGDGTIVIEGNIIANGKIKTIELQNLYGKTIVDLTIKNEKSTIKDENDRKMKTYTMDITSVAVPVQQMQIVFKVKDGETGKGCAQIGQTYEFDAGAGKSVKGSYMSFSQNRSYTFAEVVDATTGEVTANAQNVEVIFGIGEDGKPTLKSVKEAKSENFKNAAADAKIFPNAVLTSTNCIATYTFTPHADGETATVSGVIIKNGDGGFIRVDNSALFK